MPRGNSKQNQSFADATDGLSKEERDQLHKEITGEGVPFKEVQDRAREIISTRNE